MIRYAATLVLGMTLSSLPGSIGAQAQDATIQPQVGPRPFYLVDKMKDGPLKATLKQCTGPFRKTDFSIGHRGAPLQFPEHTKEVLRSGRAHGRRRDRMRRDLHQGPPARLPARAMRPAHDHEHPRQARACGEMLGGLFAGRSGHGQEGVGEVLRQRHHARRVPYPARQDGCGQCECDQRRRLHARHRAMAHRPLCGQWHADDARGKHRADQKPRRKIHAGAESAGGADAVRGRLHPGEIRASHARRVQDRGHRSEERVRAELQLSRTSSTGSRTSPLSARRPCSSTAATSSRDSTTPSPTN